MPLRVGVFDAKLTDFNDAASVVLMKTCKAIIIGKPMRRNCFIDSFGVFKNAVSLNILANPWSQGDVTVSRPGNFVAARMPVDYNSS